MSEHRLVPRKSFYSLLPTPVLTFKVIRWEIGGQEEGPESRLVMCMVQIDCGTVQFFFFGGGGS